MLNWIDKHRDIFCKSENSPTEISLWEEQNHYVQLYFRFYSDAKKLSNYLVHMICIFIKKIYLLLIVTENANVEKLFAKKYILNLTTR